MLTLLVPVLISYLLEGQTLNSANKYVLRLHETSLQWLMKIGPQYSQVSDIFETKKIIYYLCLIQFQEFKTLMTQCPDLRVKLETAIRNNQQKTVKMKNEVNINKPIVSNAPSIKLKTDFSNFS